MNPALVASDLPAGVTAALAGRDLEQAMKWCERCLEFKPPAEFSRHGVPAGKQPTKCKLCMSAKEKQWRIRTHDRYLEWIREYRKRPHVREQRADAQRLRRFRKRRAAGKTE